VCSGVIGFMLCSTAGPSVSFREPCNPIEKAVDDKPSSRRPLKFYNSAVSIFCSSFAARSMLYMTCELNLSPTALSC
jgi:spermidine synthase